MTPLLSSSSVVCWSQSQASSDLDGSVVLLNYQNGTYYTLDNVAARIWNLMQEPRKVSDICDTVVKEYEVERQRCEQDVMRLLDQAARAGLIEVRDGDAC
jgi:hypothetical protein